MNLPVFPQFKALELNNQEAVEQITKQFLPYSDHHFAGMWCWDTSSQIKISELNGNIAFILHDYITNEEFYSFLGFNKISETIDALLAQARKSGLTETVKLIPKEIADKVDQQQYHVEGDRDNYDYIINVSDAIDLGARKNKSTRKSIRNFEDLYSSKSNIRLLDLGEEADLEIIFELFEVWGAKKRIDQSEVDAERIAITRYLEVAPHVKTQTVGLFVDQGLIGFSVDEIVNNDYAMGHFHKVNVDYKGAYQYLDYAVNLELHKKGIRYINIEQDLGMENLRTAKLGHHPYKMLEKYSVSLKK